LLSFKQVSLKIVKTLNFQRSFIKLYIKNFGWLSFLFIVISIYLLQPRVVFAFMLIIFSLIMNSQSKKGKNKENFFDVSHLTKNEN